MIVVRRQARSRGYRIECTECKTLRTTGLKPVGREPGAQWRYAMEIANRHAFAHAVRASR